MAYVLHEFKDTKASQLALSKAVSRDIKEEKLKHLALSGGRSPLGFFHFLRKEDLSWEDMTVSLVDERVVDLNDKESNTNFIKKEFLQEKASKARFIPFLEHLNLEDKELLKVARSKFIQPDLAVLGMGSDGHFASLFANSLGFEEALKTTENISLIEPQNAPFKRLSMSLKAIKACKKLFLLIQGGEKKEVFDRACLGIDTNLPISLILSDQEVICNVYYSD